MPAPRFLGGETIWYSGRRGRVSIDTPPGPQFWVVFDDGTAMRGEYDDDRIGVRPPDTYGPEVLAVIDAMDVIDLIDRRRVGDAAKFLLAAVAIDDLDRRTDDEVLISNPWISVEYRSLAVVWEAIPPSVRQWWWTLAVLGRFPEIPR